MQENKKLKNDIKEEMRSLNLVLPSSIKLETAVLGAILVDRDAFYIVENILHRDMFSVEKHRLIWSACVKLNIDKIPIDTITLSEKLKTLGSLDTVGGPYYLIELTNVVASSANLEYHARIIVELWIRSRLMQNFYRNLEIAQSGQMDCFDLLSKVQNELGQMTDFVTKVGKGKRTSDILNDIKKVIRNPELVQHSYLYSGISGLDNLTSGLSAGELIIFAGRPGSGKTTLAIDMMVRMTTRFNTPSCFLSYEMTCEELLKKVIGNIAEIDSKKIRHPQLLEEYEIVQIEAASDKIEQLPMYIHEGIGLDATQIRSILTAMKSRFGIKIVFIDYLQLMPYMKGTERLSTADALGHTTRALKGIAKELGIVIVLMSQLTRDVESNKYARPIMKNLRDSGHIESDADRIIFVWRPYYHKHYQIDYEGKEMDTYGKACIIQEKFRGGSTGEVWLRAKLEFSKFEDLEGGYLEPIEKPDDFDWNNSKYQSKQTIEIGNSDNRISPDVPF